MSRVALQTGEKFQCTVLDFYARKQTHVVRSTFAAELMAMIDAVQVGSLINLVLTELYTETKIAITDLAKMQETGSYCCHWKCVLMPSRYTMHSLQIQSEYRRRKAYTSIYWQCQTSSDEESSPRCGGLTPRIWLRTH